MNEYEWADSLIDSSPQHATGFTLLLGSEPYAVSPLTWQSYPDRLKHIQEFQYICLGLFRAAIKGETDDTLSHWLLNETPASLGIEYHRSLEDRHFSIPRFFRTDEVRPGRIIELQCPGSLWGEMQIAFEFAAMRQSDLKQKSPADSFIQQLTTLIPDGPIVHHMLDNASSPSGMRFFIERTRPHVKYWGIDRAVRQKDCNFIRSHSFYGICCDNDFRSRMKKVGRTVFYDLPPHVLFDQKATVVLPFWSLTRKHFTNLIRDQFVFSTPLLPSGIELPTGEVLSIREFSHMPRSRRSYFLKYAGSDVTLNWGSKGVFRLSNMGREVCEQFLQRCLARFREGHIWLLQKEESQDDRIAFRTRDGESRVDKLRAKFSAFYGPSDCIGVLATHRHHYKVHGQADSVVSCVVPRNLLDQVISIDKSKEECS